MADRVSWGAGPTWPLLPTGLYRPSKRMGSRPRLLYSPARGQPAKGPRDTRSSYRIRQHRRQGPPVFKPLLPRMTALQSLGGHRPRGLAVGLTCFSGGLRTHRLPVTALCGTSRRTLVSGGARTQGAGLRDHRTLQTQTWPQRGPPLLPLPLTRPRAQEDSLRRPLTAEAGLQPLCPALPGPGMHYGKCSSQRTAARGASGWGPRGRTVLAVPRPGLTRAGIASLGSAFSSVSEWPRHLLQAPSLECTADPDFLAPPP